MKKCLSFLVAIILLSISSYSFAVDERYIIFVDAGSTGSRLHLFQYEESKTVPEIKDIFSENVKPGLSSFVDHPKDAGASLKTILDDAAKHLQQNGVDVHNVQINVFATAGMRLLPTDKQKAIYDNITNYLKTNYQFSVGSIQTISGVMEGLYGWLNVNYLLNNFQAHHATSGSIDMGGASTQIAFETNDTTKSNNEMTLRINNQDYHVFSTSFLGLGQDQALAAMNTDSSSANCYPLNYASNGGSGHFNLTSCSALYAGIIAKKRVVEQVAPTTNQSFIAYSGIYYAYHFLNTDSTPDQAAVESHIQTVCNESWDQLQIDYPHDKYLSTYCANAAYQDQLLYSAYQLHNGQLKVVTQLNQKDIDWTLGAAFYRLTQKN